MIFLKSLKARRNIYENQFLDYVGTFIHIRRWRDRARVISALADCIIARQLPFPLRRNFFVYVISEPKTQADQLAIYGRAFLLNDANNLTNSTILSNQQYGESLIDSAFKHDGILRDKIKASVIPKMFSSQLGSKTNYFIEMFGGETIAKGLSGTPYSALANTRKSKDHPELLRVVKGNKSVDMTIPLRQKAPYELEIDQKIRYELRDNPMEFVASVNLDINNPDDLSEIKAFNVAVAYRITANLKFLDESEQKVCAPLAKLYLNKVISLKSDTTLTPEQVCEGLTKCSLEYSIALGEHGYGSNHIKVFPAIFRVRPADTEFGKFFQTTMAEHPQMQKVLKARSEVQKYILRSEPQLKNAQDRVLKPIDHPDLESSKAAYKSRKMIAEFDTTMSRAADKVMKSKNGAASDKTIATLERPFLKLAKEYYGIKLEDFGL